MMTGDPDRAEDDVRRAVRTRLMPPPRGFEDRLLARARQPVPASEARSGSLAPPPSARVVLPSSTPFTPVRSQRVTVRTALIAVALAGTIGTTLKSSLELVAQALALGTVFGVAASATGAAVQSARTTRPWLTGLTHAIGRLLRTPWVALSPALLPVLAGLTAAARDEVGAPPPLLPGATVLSVPIGVLVLAGVPAVLVAGSAALRADSLNANATPASYSISWDVFRSMTWTDAGPGSVTYWHGYLSATLTDGHHLVGLLRCPDAPST